MIKAVILMSAELSVMNDRVQSGSERNSKEQNVAAIVMESKCKKVNSAKQVVATRAVTSKTKYDV